MGIGQAGKSPIVNSDRQVEAFDETGRDQLFLWLANPFFIPIPCEETPAVGMVTWLSSQPNFVTLRSKNFFRSGSREFRYPPSVAGSRDFQWNDCHTFFSDVAKLCDHTS